MDVRNSFGVDQSCFVLRLPVLAKRKKKSVSRPARWIAPGAPPPPDLGVGVGFGLLPDDEDELELLPDEELLEEELDPDEVRPSS